jgi:hypothetical protein
MELPDLLHRLVHSPDAVAEAQLAASSAQPGYAAALARFAADAAGFAVDIRLLALLQVNLL